MSLLSEFERASFKSVMAATSEIMGGHKVCVGHNGRIRRASAFSEYANPERPEYVVPADVAVELDRGLIQLGREPLFGLNHARLIGKALVNLPDPGGTAHGDYCALAREMGEALAAAGEIADQPHPDRSAVLRAIREIDQAVRAAIGMMHHLQDQLDGEGEK